MKPKSLKILSFLLALFSVLVFTAPSFAGRYDNGRYRERSYHSTRVERHYRHYRPSYRHHRSYYGHRYYGHRHFYPSVSLSIPFYSPYSYYYPSYYYSPGVSFSFDAY